MVSNSTSTDQLMAQAGTAIFPFLRALAHDMAGPVTATLGYSELTLQMLPPDSEHIEDLQEIETSARKLRELIGSLSRLSRFVENEDMCPARELVDDLEHLATSLCRRRGLELSFVRRGTGTEFVKGNPWVLRAACLAILGSIDGGGSREVTVEFSPEGVRLSFPEVNLSPNGPPRPDQPGNGALARELLHSQGIEVSCRGIDVEIHFPRAEDLGPE